MGVQKEGMSQATGVKVKQRECEQKIVHARNTPRVYALPTK